MPFAVPPTAFRPLLLAAAAGLAASAPAWADQNNGFGVGTAARARNAYSLDAAVSAFRMTSDASTNYTIMGDVPSTQFNGCNYGPDSTVSCVGGATGTTGTDYNLTSSHSEASLSDDVGSPVPGARDAIGLGQARADLGTGQLAASGASNMWRDYRGAPTSVGGQGWARMNDTLSFSLGASAPVGPTLIGVELRLNGTLAVTDLRGDAAVTTGLNFGGASLTYTALTGAGTQAVTEFHNDNGWVSSSWVIGTDGNMRFTGVYALGSAAQPLGFSQYLFTSGSGSGAALFGSTSHFALSLPQDVAYTSASGVFLTSAVPEPATALLWALGLGGLGLLARRRRAG